MGNSSDVLNNQILYYYLFHKKLELFFNRQHNPFFEINKKEIKLDKYYIIDKKLLYSWKEYSYYDFHKYYLNTIKWNNYSFEEYIKKLESTIKKVNEESSINNIATLFDNPGADSEWYNNNKLQKENFENVIDEKTYEYFKYIFKNELNSNIKGIITNDKLIIFYEKFCQIKFLYYINTINQGIDNNSLIQLTADFSQISNGLYDQYSTRDAYNRFKKLIQKNLDFVFKLFNEKNINYSKEATINFNIDIENDRIIGYSFKLRNDNLNSGSVNYNNSLMNSPVNNLSTNIFQNNNNLNDLNHLSNNYNFQNVSQINNYQQINNNNDYIIEIHSLKKQLAEEKEKNQILINKNKILEEKIAFLNIEINKIKELSKQSENKLAQKINELQKILSVKNKNKDYYDLSSLGPNDKVIAVNFVSMGNNDIGHYNLICKNRDLFVRLEERLYNDFPQFKEHETYFEVKGKRIKRFKTLEQNLIKNNDIISMFIIEE